MVSAPNFLADVPTNSSAFVRYNIHFLLVRFNAQHLPPQFEDAMLKASHVTAGFIAVLVGYTSSVAIVLQAAEAVGATPAQRNSWLLALGVGMGMSCIFLALKYRQPILTAWSTPGAALLATSPGEFEMSAAIGAFIFSAGLTLFFSWTGWIERALRHLPANLGAAMLAGVLLNFCLNVFSSLDSQPLLVGAMLLVWVLSFKRLSRYSVPLVLLTGLLFSYGSGLMSVGTLSMQWATPEWTYPNFELRAILSIGLPLFVVTMASQNVPGIAVLRSAGYTPPVSPLLGVTGLTSLLLAPFGGFSFNLAAITAAICAGEEADPDPRQRYKAVLVAGTFYTLVGLLGATVVALFALFPQELVLSIAGIALFGTVANSLAAATATADSREAALLTFLVTFSGLSPFGVGSPFWGLLTGALVLCLAQPKRSPTD